MREFSDNWRNYDKRPVTTDDSRSNPRNPLWSSSRVSARPSDCTMLSRQERVIRADVTFTSRRVNITHYRKRIDKNTIRTSTMIADLGTTFHRFLPHVPRQPFERRQPSLKRKWPVSTRNDNRPDFIPLYSLVEEESRRSLIRRSGGRQRINFRNMSPLPPSLSFSFSLTLALSPLFLSLTMWRDETSCPLTRLRLLPAERNVDIYNPQLPPY